MHISRVDAGPAQHKCIIGRSCFTLAPDSNLILPFVSVKVSSLPFVRRYENHDFVCDVVKAEAAADWCINLTVQLEEKVFHDNAPESTAIESDLCNFLNHL